MVSGRYRKDPRVRREKFLPLHVEGRSGGAGDRFRFRFVLFFVLRVGFSATSVYLGKIKSFCQLLLALD